jgi:hypothetical protein
LVDQSAALSNYPKQGAKRMTNKELAQALRSAASALEHGRYQTVKRKLQLVNSAWFAGNLDGVEQQIVKPENMIAVPWLRFGVKRTTERPGKHYDIVPEGFPDIEKIGCYVATIYGIEPTKENCEKIRKAINGIFETE